ncbi:spectrin beta chain, non-erythrocytic 1-like [Stegostoma tigrinum]|uniref:spectrin beta chain, non-erythrocytic 1-like n=1 Tax=Stegostoma tigrinum TaxID=3053191 RepID=UPI002870462E|nr:spectrin beta chain, non-erythrocytic 1-like [Stegostoma tigrinum]
MGGTLERMHKSQPGGIKVDSENWATYFVTLKEQALCFFENESDSLTDSPCCPKLVFSDVHCEEAADSMDKTHTFHLQLSDGNEYVFSAPLGSLRDEWIQKIRNNAGNCGGSDEMNLSSVNTSPLQSPQHSRDPFATKSQLTAGSPTKKEKPGSNKDLLPRRTPSFRVKQNNSSNLSAQRSEGQRKNWRK